MPTRTPNSLSNILSICVHETIRVVDVFGKIANQIRAVVKAASRGFTLDFGKLASMKLVFANLNNHSSPPTQNWLDRF